MILRLCSNRELFEEAVRAGGFLKIFVQQCYFICSIQATGFFDRWLQQLFQDVQIQLYWLTSFELFPVDPDM